jgi:hypothetical protein
MTGEPCRTNRSLRVRRVIDQAILGMVGKRSFAIWTTRGDTPSGECRSVGDAALCQVGDRMVWEAQGVLVWIEPAPSPHDSLGSTPGLPTAAELKRLVQATQNVPLVGR